MHGMTILKKMYLLVASKGMRIVSITRQETRDSCDIIVWCWRILDSCLRRNVVCSFDIPDGALRRSGNDNSLGNPLNLMTLDV